MGIFSTNRAVAESGVLSKDIDNVIPALESANYTAMGIELVAESEANYNAIMKAIGIGELNYFEENGREIVYEASGSNNFFEKIKQFFIKLWDKIKEIFHKFFAWLDSLTKSDTAFVVKYEKELQERWGKLTDDNFTFKGYKFTFNKFVPDTVNTSIKTGLFDAVNGSKYTNDIADETTKENIDEFVKKVNDIDINAKARALAITALDSSIKDDTMEESDFTKALHKYYHAEEKTDMKKSELGDIGTLMQTVKEGKQAKADANNAFTKFKAAFDAVISQIETMKKKADKKETNENYDSETKSSFMAGYSKILELNKAALNTTTVVNSAYLQGLKDKISQAKQILTKVLTTTIKPKNESAGVYESAESMDFLAGVVLK